MNPITSEPNIHTFRAASLHEALQLVREALGPEASVLEVKQGQKSRMFGLLRGDSFVEVSASNEINVPSRLKRRAGEDSAAACPPSSAASTAATVVPSASQPVSQSALVTPERVLFANNTDTTDYSDYPDYSVSDARYSAETLGRPQPQSGTNNQFSYSSAHFVNGGSTGFGASMPAGPAISPAISPSSGAFSEAPIAVNPGSPWNAMLQSLQQRQYSGVENWTPALFKTYNDLIDADMSESVAKDLVFQVGSRLRGAQANHLPTIQSQLLEQIASEIPVTGPIVPKHRGHLVALVGPTGVGKTTTIAKLAAHYCLNERRRVGLITVDTYRIAAVEQLRVYANIIDLPMLVVRNLQEMRQAVNRMRNLDLILMDTAGRGAKEELKIHELKTFIDEAKADEVQLVLSGTSGSRSLCLAAQTFAQTGITSLIMTKLDEVLGLGNLLPLLRSSNLPLSYITNGQSVPEDFEVANPLLLAHMALGHTDALKRSESLARQ